MPGASNSSTTRRAVTRFEVPTSASGASSSPAIGHSRPLLLPVTRAMGITTMSGAGITVMARSLDIGLP